MNSNRGYLKVVCGHIDFEIKLRTMGFKSPYGPGGMFEQASKKLFENAKLLRSCMTASELKLWEYLKHGINGVKFRRQHPIGKYVGDFFCHKAKLIIEVDGSVHDSEEAQILDEERTKDLQAWGYRVIRFTNHQVSIEFDHVIATITKEIDHSNNK